MEHAVPCIIVCFVECLPATRSRADGHVENMQATADEDQKFPERQK